MTTRSRSSTVSMNVANVSAETARPSPLRSRTT
jgi:hypothetical protein